VCGFFYPLLLLPVAPPACLAEKGREATRQCLVGVDCGNAEGLGVRLLVGVGIVKKIPTTKEERP